MEKFRLDNVEGSAFLCVSRHFIEPGFPEVAKIKPWDFARFVREKYNSFPIKSGYLIPCPEE